MGSAGLQAGSKKASAQRLPPAQQTVLALLAEVPRDDAIARRGLRLAYTATPEPSGATLPDTIQTSAVINWGNGGGVLVNIAGCVRALPCHLVTMEERDV
jgi:hypothetical protein